MKEENVSCVDCCLRTLFVCNTSLCVDQLQAEASEQYPVGNVAARADSVRFCPLEGQIIHNLQLVSNVEEFFCANNNFSFIDSLRNFMHVFTFNIKLKNKFRINLD